MAPYEIERYRKVATNTEKDKNKRKYYFSFHLLAASYTFLASVIPYSPQLLSP